MAEAPSPHPTDRLLAEAGWSPLLDRLLARFCHDLSGRAMALDAAVRFLNSGRPPPPSLPEDVDRVWEISELLSLLPADVNAPPTAVLFHEALAPAVRLYGTLLDDGEGPVGIEVSADLPPLLVSETRFSRAMLLFLDLVGPSSDGEPSVRVTGDSNGVEIRAKIPREVAETVNLSALAAVFSLDSAHLSVEDGQCCVRFESLAVARSRMARGEMKLSHS